MTAKWQQKAVLVAIFVLALCLITMFEVARPSGPEQVFKVDADRAARMTAIAELTKELDAVVCPAFLDAPIGYKKCPEKVAIENEINLLRSIQ
jgi:hypothetical protein